MRIQFSEDEFMEDLYQRENRSWMYSDTKIRKPEQHPDARLHKIVSFIKSGVRILGYCFLPFELNIAAIILILSEAIGIIEETV